MAKIRKLINKGIAVGILLLVLPQTAVGIVPLDDSAVTDDTTQYSPLDDTSGGNGCKIATLPNIVNEAGFAAAINQYIEQYAPTNSPLKGLGEDYVKAGTQYNVNPALIINIARKESQFGTNGRSATEGFNAYGRTASAGQPSIVTNRAWYRWDSHKEAVYGEAQFLKEEYIDKGFTDYTELFMKYAPPSENDTTTYIAQINQWVDELMSLAGAAVNCGGSGSNVVAIAQQQVGLKEDPPGCNCGPEIQKFLGSVTNQTWCANFVSWVYREAGFPFTGGQDGGWRLPAAIGVVNWMKQNGQYTVRGPGVPAPQPGDIIYFNFTANGDVGGDSDHVGIVEETDGTTINTIEGNTSNGVYRRSYNLNSNTTIKGWGGLR